MNELVIHFVNSDVEAKVFAPVGVVVAFITIHQSVFFFYKSNNESLKYI